MPWDFIVWIASFSAMAFGVVLFAVQWLALEIGFWLGRRSVRGKADPPAGVGMIVGGMLGLLAFVLALTLSHASARFEARRTGALAEANAIGTAWLRAKAIGHPGGDAIAAKLADYTQLRIDFIRARPEPAGLAELNARTNAAQTDIWRHMTAIAHDRQDPVVASLMAALNEMFDRATAERFAFAFAIPPLLLWLIVGLAVASITGVGYELGLRGASLRLLSMVLIGMWTVVATLILDLGSPRLGSIRTNVAIYEWTLTGFAAGGSAAPALR